jgi:hypothetical protein
MSDFVREIKKAFGNTRARTLSCINQRMVDDRDRAYTRPSVELRWWQFSGGTGEIVYKGGEVSEAKVPNSEAR